MRLTRAPDSSVRYDLAVNEGEGWVLGERPASCKLDSKLRRLAWRWAIPLRTLTRCRFCGCHMRLAQERSEGTEVLQVDVPAVRGYMLEFCPRCAHWRFWAAEERCMDVPRLALAMGVQARFAAHIPPGCHAELAQALTRKPEQWNCVDPLALEHLVAEIFRRNFAPCEVKHVGRAGDGGKDVVYVAGGGDRWLIQVKGRWNPKRSEPVTTIRSLVGTLVDEGVPHGIVVTTADAFSRDAYAAVQRYDARGYRIRLIDRGLLRELLGPLVPRRPWESLFHVPAFVRLGEEILPHTEGALLPDQLGLYD